jgi:hypothetical protein
MSSEMRRRSLDLLKTLNTAHRPMPAIPRSNRASVYEMAYKMQFSVPELSNIESEPPRCTKCTARSRAEFIREQLPAGAASGRAGRAHGPALPSRLGHHGSSNNEDIVNKLTFLCRDTDQPPRR